MFGSGLSNVSAALTVAASATIKVTHYILFKAPPPEHFQDIFSGYMSKYLFMSRNIFLVFETTDRTSSRVFRS
jgi:hypothetical protein